MDWSPAGAAEADQQDDGDALLLLPQPAELEELCLPSLGPSSQAAGRQLGRKISHKKSASDTWAFAAAGQDFLASLDSRGAAAEHAGHARTASVGGGLTSTCSYAAQGAPGGSAQFDLPRPPYLAGHNSLPQDSSHAASITSQEPGAAAAGPVAAAASAGPLLQSQLEAAAAPSADAMAADAAAAAAAADDDEGTAPKPPEAAVAAGATAAEAAAGAGKALRRNALDPSTLDERKARRIVANRKSAQRSRQKVLQKKHDLESGVERTEAAVQDMAAKVRQAEQSHAAASYELEQLRAEAASLQQQLQHEQYMQAVLSSHVQHLQLKLQQQPQQQQQWGCFPQQLNAYQVQHMQGAQQQQQQQCAGSNGQEAHLYTCMQQQQQRLPHSQDMQNVLQLQACGFAYSSRGQAAGEGVAANAAAAASAQASAALQQQQQQHQQQQLLDAARPQPLQLQPLSVQQPLSQQQQHQAAAAAVSPAGIDAARPSASSGGRMSLASQGSGSVLLHGSDNELESLPWLAVDGQLGVAESQELQQLLAGRPMGLLGVEPDDLLAREGS